MSVMSHELGLKYFTEMRPAVPFKFEPPVILGRVEISRGVLIGRHSYIVGGFVYGGIEIGRYCSLGRGVNIGGGHHEMTQFSTSSFFKNRPPVNSTKLADPKAGRRIKLGHDVWVGAGVLIINGAEIGHGAVIGAGSVVTKSVEPYTVVAGNPARPIKDRFDDATKAKMLESRWWDYPESVLENLPQGDIEASLAILRDTDAPLTPFPDPASLVSLPPPTAPKPKPRT